MILRAMKPKGQKKLTQEQQRELLGYHNKGLSYIEVANLMRVKPNIIKNKAFRMGVTLRSK